MKPIASGSSPSSRSALPMPAAYAQAITAETPQQNAHAGCKPEWRRFDEKIRDGGLKQNGILSLEDFQDLASYLATSPAGLHTLDLIQQSIGHAEAQALSQALKVNTNLTALGISDCEIDAAGMASLSQEWKVNTRLTGLNFCGCWFGATGMASLSEALRVNTSLKLLTFVSCNIDADGMASLLGALKINTSLIKLILSSNVIAGTLINAAGMASLSAALEINTSLTSLNLAYNGITAPGAASLLKALKVNTSLTTLVLDGNGINPAELTAISQALEKNRLRKSLPAASVGLELASGCQYPPELMPLILEHMLVLPGISKQAAMLTISGLAGSISAPMN